MPKDLTTFGRQPLLIEREGVLDVRSAPTDVCRLLMRSLISPRKLQDSGIPPETKKRALTKSSRSAIKNTGGSVKKVLIMNGVQGFQQGRGKTLDVPSVQDTRFQ